MEKKKQDICCTVDHCKYYYQKKCTLDSIMVAKCDEEEKEKEATMCDSYKKE